jgi:ribonuclease E
LRLRDLAGLIVIDFIDMEENRNNSAVERRLKEALKNDRARIQIGRISTFGLLEMSRQRALAPGGLDGSLPARRGGRVWGLIRIGMVEEEITRQHSPGVTVNVPAAVALYILNQKRAALTDVESRRGIRIYVQADESLTPPDFKLERIKQLAPGEEIQARPMAPTLIEEPADDLALAEDELADTEAEAAVESDGESIPAIAQAKDEDARHGRKRRRRRGRGGRLRADEFTEAERPAPSGEATQAARKPLMRLRGRRAGSRGRARGR